MAEMHPNVSSHACLSFVIRWITLYNRTLMARTFFGPWKFALDVGGGWGVSGVAKVSCILRHRGVQLILAYSWARLAILAAGKGRRECFYFFCFFLYIPVPLSFLCLSFIFSTISSISFLPFSGKRHNMTHKGWRVVKPQHDQSNNLDMGSLNHWGLMIAQVRWQMGIIFGCFVFDLVQNNGMLSSVSN